MSLTHLVNLPFVSLLRFWVVAVLCFEEAFFGGLGLLEAFRLPSVVAVFFALFLSGLVDVDFLRLALL